MGIRRHLGWGLACLFPIVLLVMRSGHTHACRERGRLLGLMFRRCTEERDACGKEVSVTVELHFAVQVQ